MAEKTDRPVKRRFEILIGRYTANPLMRGLFRIGITPPGMALVETTGRKTGAVRRTPVNCMADGETLWLIAQHGRHAGWVLNFEADPAVRAGRLASLSLPLAAVSQRARGADAAVQVLQRISQRSGKTGRNSVLRRYSTPDDPPVPPFAPMIRSTACTWR